MAAYEDEYVMRDDETLDQLLEALKAQNAETLRIFAEADLDTPVPVPHDVPWFPQDVEHWSVRWVAMHLIEELSRHAGHADIIRESIDGATMYELMAGIEGWPEDRLDQALETRDGDVGGTQGSYADPKRDGRLRRGRAVLRGPRRPR